MKYTIKCEKCGRPADIEKQITNEQTNRPTTTTTTYKRACPICGGTVKPLLD
ncbi:MAG: hypothetical protein GX072_09495 [Lysinibacillus sp.]|nr:hypothetical protein [Lysinibacillus sp.]